MPELTKEQVDAMVEAHVGKAIAEQRKEAEAKAVEERNDPHVAALRVAASREEQEKKEIDEAGGFKAYTESMIEKGQRKSDAYTFMKCVMAGRTLHGAEQVAKHYGNERVAATIKAMGTNTLPGGGALVPPVYVDEIIPDLKAKSVMGRMGITEMVMEKDQLSLPKVTGGSTVTWTEENTNITETSITTGEVHLRAKKLAATVALSNELLRTSDAESVVRDDLLRSANAAMDLAMIRGSGVAGVPAGLFNQVASAHKFNATSAGTSSTLAEKNADIEKMIRLILEDDIDLETESPGFLFSPRTTTNLKSQLDSNGHYVFRDEMSKGLFWGIPYATTNNIPSNLGTGSNESEVYLAAFKSLVKGIGRQMEIKAFDGGAYHNGSAVVSGISLDQTVIRLAMSMDMQARQDGNEIAVLEDVKWF